MKLSMNWLNEFVKLDVTPKDFCNDMTMSGSKVETVDYLGADVINVVVGRVEDIVRHENSDHMFVCKVNVGKEELLQIVTGAQNVNKGDLVPVALNGSTLPGGIKIKTGKLRGVVSEGMLCSFKELGLTQNDCPDAYEDGIWILNEGTPGQDMKELCGLNDYVVDFEITSNRHDCLSIIGLAREAAATYDKDITLHTPVVSKGTGDINDMLKIDILNPELCPRYTARIVKNIKIEPSPKWMRERLRACGVRPINNIVDITNYVMLEYGQPMHAFDYACLHKGHIKVRKVVEGDTMTTLDGQERKLKPSMLVIADDDHPVAVAGVMGGLDSEITDKTNTVVFESANFNGTSVRQTAISLAMRTDASGRFEKDLAKYLTIPAVERACELVEMLGAGEVVGGMIDVKNYDETPVTIKLDTKRINDLLGTMLDDEYIIKCIEKVGCKVHGDVVTSPVWRTDLTNINDLAEEVARFYGYNNIPSTIFNGNSTQGGYTDKQKCENIINNTCRGLGYNEIMTYSFISPSHFDKLKIAHDSPLRNCIRILNPLGEDTSVMRTSALATMLEALSRNYNRRNTNVKLYEPASIYIPTDDMLPYQPTMYTLGEFGQGCDFYSIKGDIETIFEELNIKNVRFITEKNNPSYHPGRCANIYIGETMVGVVGQVHPAVASAYDINVDVYASEFNFNILFENRCTEVKYKPLPKFPATTRDLAVVCDKSITVYELQECIRKSCGKNCESVELFDVYTGNQIAEGKKSVAFTITLRTADRTLTDKEVDSAITKAITNLESELGAILR